MKTLTVEEATRGLGHLVELAIAGELIQIRQGYDIVELRPTQSPSLPETQSITPLEALRLLQQTSDVTQQQAEQYLKELTEERLASAGRRPS